MNYEKKVVRLEESFKLIKKTWKTYKKHYFVLRSTNEHLQPDRLVTNYFIKFIFIYVCKNVLAFLNT